MSLESGWNHTTYSPVLLLAAASVVSLGVATILTWAHARRQSGAGWLLLTVALSPLPLLLLSYAHLPMLSSLRSGTGFCFGEIGSLHIVSFLLPPSVGLLTLVGLRTGAAGEPR
jgi:hypothetical protein